MGLKADAVGENDNLAALGIDSMQLMEARPPLPDLAHPLAHAGHMTSLHACMELLSFPKHSPSGRWQLGESHRAQNSSNRVSGRVAGRFFVLIEVVVTCTRAGTYGCGAASRA